MKEENYVVQFMDVMGEIYEKDLAHMFSDFLRGETKILHFLNSMTGASMSPSELSDKLGVTRARITSAITTLEKKGFAQRNMAPEDRRRIDIVITDKGREYIVARYNNLEQDIQYFLKTLSDAEITAFLGVLKKLNAVID